MYAIDRNLKGFECHANLHGERLSLLNRTWISPFFVAPVIVKCVVNKGTRMDSAEVKRLAKVKFMGKDIVEYVIVCKNQQQRAIHSVNLFNQSEVLTTESLIMNSVFVILRGTLNV
uniref:Cyclic nucleotide-binding domain-containing protein n=1 Tax=Panagrellus redivivus TaxID=6233 RepID=A0A7E4ZZ58_PANRE